MSTYLDLSNIFHLLQFPTPSGNEYVRKDTALSVLIAMIQSKQLDMFWSVVLGVIGGVLVLLTLKIWEARSQRKTSEMNENRRQGSNECVFQQSTGKQPQEHDNDFC